MAAEARPIRPPQGGPKAKQHEYVFCNHCKRAGSDEVSARFLKKNLRKHTSRKHSGLEDVWIITWSAFAASASAQPTPSSVIGTTIIWCKNCHLEGKDENASRMMKKNLLRHSKNHRSVEYLISWPGKLNTPEPLSSICPTSRAIFRARRRQRR